MDEHYENCIEDLNLEPATTHEEEDDLLEDSVSEQTTKSHYKFILIQIFLFIKMYSA